MKGVSDTIEKLTEELAPVNRMAHPYVRIVPWVALSLLYTAGAIYVIGVRPDLLSKLSDPLFLFEIALMASVSLSAAFAASWLCVPDSCGRKWMPFLPIGFLSVFMMWSVIRAITQGLLLQAPHWDHCFSDALMMGTMPGMFIIFLTIRGTTTRPAMMSLMSILAVTGMGYIGLRFTCMMDTVGHSLIYHVFPFAVFGALLGVIARRIYSW